MLNKKSSNFKKPDNNFTKIPDHQRKEDGDLSDRYITTFREILTKCDNNQDKFAQIKQSREVPNKALFDETIRTVDQEDNSINNVIKKSQDANLQNVIANLEEREVVDQECCGDYQSTNDFLAMTSLHAHIISMPQETWSGRCNKLFYQCLLPVTLTSITLAFDHIFF